MTWVVATTLVIAAALFVWSRRRFGAFAQRVIREYPLRIFDLRAFRWWYHDLLLHAYLGAQRIPSTPMIVFTGDSTVAQINVAPQDAIAGQLDYLMSSRREGRTCRVVNIGVNGTAEAYLDISIRAALASGAQHVLAGITLRDYTHVPNEEARSRFLGYASLRYDFRTGPAPSVLAVWLRRMWWRARFALAGADVLTDSWFAYPTPAPSSRTSPPLAPPALYVAEDELAQRTRRKNEMRDLLIDRNPYVQRLEVVMRRFARDRERVSFVLLPMNRSIDVERFGLDPAIPISLAKRIRDIAEEQGLRLYDLGCLWDGDVFAPEDVVHLNRQGSMTAAAMLTQLVPEVRMHASAVRPLRLEELADAYRAGVDPDTYRRTVQLIGENESFRLVASGDARAFLSMSLDTPVVLIAEPRDVMSWPPPRLQIVRSGGDLLLDEPLASGVEVQVRAAPYGVDVTHTGWWLKPTEPGLTLQIGYLDTSSADREFVLDIRRIFAIGVADDRATAP